MLVDEMGLGKTCQIISYFHRLRYSHGMEGPVLVVAPLATLQHWKREFAAWSPETNQNRYHGNDVSRQVIRDYEFYCESGDRSDWFDVLVTNYETLLIDQELLSFRRREGGKQIGMELAHS